MFLNANYNDMLMFSLCVNQLAWTLCASNKSTNSLAWKLHESRGLCFAHTLSPVPRIVIAPQWIPNKCCGWKNTINLLEGLPIISGLTKASRPLHSISLFIIKEHFSPIT